MLWEAGFTSLQLGDGTLIPLVGIPDGAATCTA
jgi:hypothetical protein